MFERLVAQKAIVLPVGFGKHLQKGVCHLLSSGLLGQSFQACHG